MTFDEMRDTKKFLGYSNKMLAEKSGVPLGTLQKILSGETERPRYKTLAAIEKALDDGLRNIDWNKRLKGLGDYEAMLVRESAELAYKYFAEDHKEPEAVPDVVEDSWSRKWRRQGTYTVRDYESIPDGVRVELIDGVIYDMAAPSFEHQIIAGAVYRALADYRDKKGSKDCIPLIAPYDVQLDMDDKTMVQPDVLVVCRKKGRDLRKRLYGAPEFVLEVISPSTKKRDVQDKQTKYMNAGVREYWIVDPDERSILVYDFEHVKFPEKYTFYDKVPVMISGGDLEIDFNVIRDELESFE